MEDDEALHDALTNAFLDRAKKPIVWSRLNFGIRIEDLHPPYYEEVIDLIKRHYVPDDPMFMSLNFSRQEESLEEFLSLCNTWIRDTCSIVAVEEGEKKAVGVLIGRVFIKKDNNREFSRMLESKSPSPEQSEAKKPLRRQSQTQRRGSKKSIRRQSAKKSIRRQSAKKSIRRQSAKKSIRRQSAKKSIRRQSAKRRQSKSGKSTSRGSKSKLHEDKKPERINKFPKPIDKILKAPKKKKIITDCDDETAIYKTEALKKIQSMKQFVSKNYDVFVALSKTKYYKIYLLTVHRDYRRRGIGKALLKSLFGLCRGFRIEVAAGLFTSFISQNMFFKLGGKIGYEINYEDWLVDGEIVFGNTADPNYSLALMYMDIAEIEKESLEKIEERPQIPRRADLKEKEKGQ